LPAIGCVAVVKPVSAQCQTRRGCNIYDCFAADRRQASSYRDCDRFQTLVKSSGSPTAARSGGCAARTRRYGRGLCPVGAGLPAIGCAAVAKPVSAQCQTRRGCSIYDCFAADRRQASSYRDCDHFQTLVKSQGRRQQPGRGVVLHGRDGTPYALPCRSWLACDRLRSSRKTGICVVPDVMRMQHLRLLRSRSQASQLLQGLRSLSDSGQKPGPPTAARSGGCAARTRRYGRGLCPVGAGLPAIGCAAVAKPVSAQCQTRRGCSIYDCFAADRRQASSYRDCDHFQTLVKSQGRRQQPGRGVRCTDATVRPWALPCRSWLACDRLRSSRKTGIRAVPDKARMQHLRLLRSRSQASQLLQGLRSLSDFGQKPRVADSSQVGGLCCTDATVRP